MAANPELIKSISRRLLIALVSLLGLLAFVIVFESDATTLSVCMIVGAIGGFVSLQRRLKELPEDDLTLISSSWIYAILAPLVGGILAVLLYVLFISKLLAGELFPMFEPDVPATPKPVGEPNNFSLIFAIHGAAAADYAKLVFWSFVAGFSEKFVIDIVSKFQDKASKP